MRQQTLPNTNRANHSNLGKGFEAELCAVHDFYRLQGWVDVVQNPNAWDFAKDRDYFTAKANFLKGQPNAAKTGDNNFYLQRVYSDVDFSGGNGRGTYVFDAKETKSDRFPLSNIKPNQIARLNQSARCGTCAGIMLKFSEQSRVFFIPAKYLDTKYINWAKQTGKIAKKGTASISLKEAMTNGREIFRDKRNGLWDWFRILQI